MHPRKGVPASSSSQPRPWKKVLYTHQGVPDDYLPASFLEALRTNENTQTYDYWTTVQSTLVVALQICGIVNIVSAQMLLQRLPHSTPAADEDAGDPLQQPSGWLSIDGWGLDTSRLHSFIASIAGHPLLHPMQELAHRLTAKTYADRQMRWAHSLDLSMAALLLGFLFGLKGLSNVWLHHIRSDNHAPAVRRQPPVQNSPRMTALLLLVSLLFLLPLLFSLTDSISTDTIWAMAGVSFVGNLLLHDYRSSDFSVHAALALNLGLFGCMCLASRLESLFQVFCFLGLGVALFAYVPRMYHGVQSPMLRVGGTLVAAALTLFVLWIAAQSAELGHHPLLYLGLSLVFVCLLCPMWLVRVQRYKSEIHGPWDEAIIGGVLEGGKAVVGDGGEH